MNLTRNDWKDGWIPSDDEINGRKSGLLRMDNLNLDENGVVSLVKGTQLIATYNDGYLHSLYSKYFNSTKFRFIGLSDGSVRLQSGTRLLQDGSPNNAAFCTMFGHVIVTSGSKKIKFTGTESLDLGIKAPGQPVVTRIAPDQLVIAEAPNYVVVDGTAVSSTVFTTTDTSGSVYQLNTINLQETGFSGIHSPEDLIQFKINFSDVTKVVSVSLQINLDNPIASDDYYWFQWTQGESDAVSIPAWNSIDNGGSAFSATKGDFNRIGTNVNLDWRNVKGCVLQVIVTEVIDWEPFSIVMVAHSAIFGLHNEQFLAYEYVVVAVYDGITYQGKSALSPISEVIYLNSGHTLLTWGATPTFGTFKYWIYRRSADPSADVTRIGESPKLDQFYRVGISDTTSFTDTTSDEEALELGITIDPSVVGMADLNDEVLDMAGPLFGRVLYMTYKDVIISSFGDIDSYNSFHVIRLSGSQAEKNLWIAKVGPGTAYVATTGDIYEITGTFRELPDGSLDIQVRPLGIGYAPISKSKCVDGGTVYYIGPDGWRRTSGNGSELMLGDVDKLWRGETRYEYPPVATYPNALAVYACALYRNQLWTFNPHTDGTRRGLVYDFVRKYWHTRLLEAISLYVEEDGMLIAGFGGGSGNVLLQLDIGNTVGGAGQSVNLLTCYDDNNQPRNRKDVFTCKITADTGGVDVLLEISRDKGPFIPLGTTNFNGPSEQLFEILSKVPLGFRYALRAKGTGFSTFKLINFTIEYEPRPEQLNTLRIPNTNLNTVSRKRFTQYAFVIDTLGNNVTFTPMLDNTALATSVVNEATKLSYIHYFTNETIGTDIGGLLLGGPFEFYGINPDEIVSEKLPTPRKFLIIPQDDYGQPNRKRHSSYKFQINTKGASVRFIPKIDGTTYTPLDFSTTEKRTVEYFFTTDTIGIDIGGTLASLADTPFEFYGVVKPQQIEILPPRLKEFYAPITNFGIAAKKRIRTIPIIIDTNGNNVTFTPIIDGNTGTPSTIITNGKTTAFHYFTTDIFGIDFGGEFVGSSPFEFYEFGKPENVEVLPVSKKFDQIGPVDFDRLGKLLAFRVRVITEEVNLPYTIYKEDTAVATGTIVTIPNVDKVYEVMKLAKTIAGTVFRIELGPTTLPFNRYSLEMKVNISGMDTDAKWIKIK